jgi:DNA replication protein DnaC
VDPRHFEGRYRQGDEAAEGLAPRSAAAWRSPPTPPEVPCERARARVEERLVKLRLGAAAQRLDAVLSAAARAEPTCLAFLDQLLAEETEAKQKKRVAMGIQIAHVPALKTLEELDFKFQPSIDAELVRAQSTGRFIAGAENILRFGPPGVG